MTKINGEYVSPKIVCKIVKATLAERFGYKNVSVTKGTGTASGWIRATIEVEKPHDCYCKPFEVYCSRCKELMQSVGKEARERLYTGMGEAGASFTTYYGDMDNEPQDCFNLSIRIKK